MMNITANNIGILSEKDKESRVVKCNHMFLTYAGTKSDGKILGFTDYDFPWQQYADVYRKHELEVLNGNDYSIIFPLVDAYGVYKVFLHNKAGIRDPRGNVVGIACNAVEIVNPDAQHLFAHLVDSGASINNKFYFGKQFDNYCLSQREQQVLFFLTKGKTSKAIASILKMAPRTVMSHVESIKRKLGCHTKNELIDKAHNIGFAQSIPAGISYKKMLEGIEE